MPGNHDVGDRPTADTLKKYRDAFGKDYFSFEHKGYAFVFADSSLWKSPIEGETQKQDEWFKKTLEAAHDVNSPVFVIQHYPIFMQNPDESDSSNNLPIAKRKEILALLVTNGVVAVLGGHRHDTVINDYKGIQLVICEATSKSLGRSSLGFRVWKVSPGSIKNDFVPLKK